MTVSGAGERSRSRTTLTGWGRTSPSSAYTTAVTQPDDVMEVVRRGSSRGVLARGLGRSYGDSAQNAGGEVLLMEHMASTHSFDPDTGILDVDAGASVDSIITEFLPRGWFVPVSPGTRAVTVGGAIAADVHGKNHHAVGSFGMHVRSLDLVAGDGTVRTLSPESTPDQFWATVGGMGLTGVIIRARVTLQKVPSSSLLVETQRCDGLDELMARQVELDQQHRYVVAWIDCLTKGPRLGRGVITAGDFAAVSALPAERAADPLAYEPGRKVPTPPFVPSGLLNRFSVAAFNEAWFRKAPRSKTDEIQSMATFFHPLDGVQGWNRLYGPAGFVQYQFVVPESGAEVVRTAIERLSAIGAASFLGVLKRFGDASPAPLSFPMPGWTLALDIPTGVVGLADTLDDLDELVAQAGGRIYLAKDSRLRPRWLPAMYPRLAEWRAVRDDMDPHGVFVSDQFRRLQP